MFRNLKFSRKTHSIYLTMTILFASVIFSTTASAATKITTYYWDNGWIEHATWISTAIGKDLKIDINAWNFEPEYSSLSVKYDNVFGSGDIDRIVTSGGLIDDFNDGILSPIWQILGIGADVYEAAGVLNIDIFAGSAGPGLNHVAGVQTKSLVIHGDFDVQVDFSLDPEYHITPNTNAGFFLTDQIGNQVELSIRNGSYQSKDLPIDLSQTADINWTPTDHLNGKLRMTGIIIKLVDLDVKPKSCPNPLNVKTKGLLPVAVLGSYDLDATEIDPASVRLAGVAPLRSRLIDVSTPFEPFTDKEDCFEDCNELGTDGYLDLILKFRVREIVQALGDVENKDCLVLSITGNLKEEFGGTPIFGEDLVLIKKK
jgi:hypothetical protein